jgi:hypothetical protein
MISILTKILDKDVILKFNKKSKIVKLTFRELKKLLSEVEIPDLQSDLQEIKIIEMVESYKEYPHHIGSRCLLTISHVVIGAQEKYYLIDGQHRINMAIELYKENINDTMLVSIIEVNSEKEFKKLFEDINKDSSKCKFKDYSIFTQEIYEKLKTLLKNKYGSFIPLKSADRNSLYSNSQFVDKLISKNIIDYIRNKINNNNCETIFNYLIDKEKIYFNLCEYKENYNKSKKEFSGSEKKSIEENSCMYMKKNNFIDWLMDNNIEPKHCNLTRLPIKKDLQKKVWEKMFQSNTSGQCPIYNCNNILDFNIVNSWHCGHIISVYNGGTTDLDNLKPI